MNSRLTVIGLMLLAIGIARACSRDDTRPSRDERADRQIQEQLQAPHGVDAKEGLAAAIVIDVSGSMADDVRGIDGRREPKIEIARRAAVDIVQQFARYAEERQDEPVLLGIYEFSRRRGEPDCRPVIPMAPPDRTRAASAIATLIPDGGTPIGQAMIVAKRELDRTGLTRRHLLLVTDGENTDGFAPHRVTAAIARRPEIERPSIYFVAFDVDAGRFARVRDAGALVLPAANAEELNETLDTLLTGKILVEK